MTKKAFRLLSGAYISEMDYRELLLHPQVPPPHCIHCQCGEAAKGMVDRGDFDRMRNALFLIAGTMGTECANPRAVAHEALSGSAEVSDGK